ncbi:MAG: NapC/NirT family cytochrome c [Aquincola sp.]|nr:NapC/NirT family cytochrome c [Aquincola sp.]MDH5330794.1 NapC/NirT family cytochrome c [Aquincola sp.]
MIQSFVSLVTRHWISMLGSVIALVAAVLVILLFGMEITGFKGGPYLGILTYLLLPAVFVFGLVLIPVGVLRKRRLDADAIAHHEQGPRLPVIDLNNDRTRGVVLASVAIAALSVVLLGSATYKGVEVMESVGFCGTVCHTVMQPEYTAFQRSPHSKLRCADCHIGPGADWFVKSKLSGSWQMIAVAANLYPTPIPQPVHNLRPARETCEQCHWPNKHIGDRLQVRTKFTDDEKNSETKTVLMMKVGGQQGSTSNDIHWHVDPGVKIRYLSDPTRQKIYDIELTSPDGKTKIYKTEDKPDGATEWREMDCVDCHNRPSHTYKMPEQEIDAAMADGRIDKTLPFVKREGVRVLREEYASHEAARAGITKEIEGFYKAKYADVSGSRAGAISAAATALGDIYSWNVFPKMKVTWGTYTNNLGHSDEAPGCWRCHDKKHSTAEGNKIGRNCKTCHVVLAEDEADPEILKQLKP